MIATSSLIAQEDQSAQSVVQDQPPEAVSLFYPDLASYGEWIEFEPGLYAWHPLDIEPGWRPYTRGRWIWSDYGWFWVTEEPFGWATYHYGRWYLDDTYGWIWIPDTVWGPAWVEWRCNSEYIGWAPLPPYAKFHLTVGIRFTREWTAPLGYWSFVNYDRFASRHAYRDYVPEVETRRLISTSRSTGRYEIGQNRIINEGVNRSFIQHRTSYRIESVEVTRTNERGVERFNREGTTERLEVYQPRTDHSRGANVRIEARKALTRPSFDIDRVDAFRRPSGQDGRTTRGQSSRSQQRFELPGSQQHPPERADQRQPTRPGQRDRLFRARPKFPSPRVNRTSPHQPPAHKDQDSPRGRRRDRF